MYGDDDVLRCGAMWTSALKTETVCSSETLVFAYEFTKRHNPEEQCRLHRRENLRSQMYGVCL
jgi:hypothetical protein